MKDLLDFILLNILGDDSKFTTTEEDDGSICKLTVTTPEEFGGIVIGKQGKTVKAIRNLLRIKAVLLKRKVILLVNPLN